MRNFFPKPLLLTEMPEQEKQFIEVISKAQKETVGVQLQINPIDGRFQNMGLKSSKIISEISDLFKKEDLKVSLIESSGPKTSNSNIPLVKLTFTPLATGAESIDTFFRKWKTEIEVSKNGNVIFSDVYNYERWMKITDLRNAKESFYKMTKKFLEEYKK